MRPWNKQETWIYQLNYLWYCNYPYSAMLLHKALMGQMCLWQNINTRMCIFYNFYTDGLKCCHCTLRLFHSPIAWPLVNVFKVSLWCHQWHHECVTHNLHNYKSPPICMHYCPACGAFDLGLAVSVPLPIVTGIFVLLWFQSRLT